MNLPFVCAFTRVALSGKVERTGSCEDIQAVSVKGHGVTLMRGDLRTIPSE